MERQSVLRGCGCAAAALAAIVGGGLLLVLGGTWAAGAVMNAGPVDLQEIEPTWSVSIRGMEAEDRGTAMTLKQALEKQCVPMSNGVRVLFNHAWYNALTSGYDAQIWIENKKQYDSYALYAWGNHVFLRDEVGRGGYVNRVLTCDIDADGWLRMAR